MTKYWGFVILNTSEFRVFENMGISENLGIFLTEI